MRIAREGVNFVVLEIVLNVVLKVVLKIVLGSCLLVRHFLDDLWLNQLLGFLTCYFVHWNFGELFWRLRGDCSMFLVCWKLLKVILGIDVVIMCSVLNVLSILTDILVDLGHLNTRLTVLNTVLDTVTVLSRILTLILALILAQILAQILAFIQTWINIRLKWHFLRLLN